MPPTTSRDFQKAAWQRLTTEETLLRHKLTLDAQYLGGYAAECSLKALILHQTPDPDKPDQLKRITSGAKMHRPEVLLGELGKLEIQLPLDIVKRMRRFDWTTDLRYETGRRDTGETIGFLRTANKTRLAFFRRGNFQFGHAVQRVLLEILKTVRTIYDWVEDQLP